jgi:predicted polyphosphate/ATP-dependent NAD kinase
MSERVTAGLVINPVAGMGGSVGLKGTDGTDTLSRAIELGAKPIAARRAKEALGMLAPEEVRFLTAGREMGEDVLRELGFEHEVVHPVVDPSSDDTVKACTEFLERGADIIVFVGGDGTARDVMSAVDETVPVIGVPSGVKMHSSVFTNTPEDAGRLLHRFAQGGMESRPGEVMDIDEEAFREGRLSASLHGHMLVPYEPALVQHSKSVFESPTVEEEKDEIAQYFVENMDPGTLYILGPGTTVAAVAERMGVRKTLLGVDVYRDSQMIGEDVNENALLEILEGEDNAEIVITPIGAQGFIFGRGNQQLSSAVIRKVGKERIRVLATPTKLRDTPQLMVDTGDLSLDEELRGHIRALVGYGRERLVWVA